MMIYWLGYALILGIIGGGLLAAIIWLSRRPSQRWLLNGLLVMFSLFITLMALEAGFKLFFAQSDGFRYTLASQNWYDRHWEENTLGYRDVEWTAEQLADKTTIMVVGDSFAAGSGIADPQDRFANQLGQQLGEDVAVMVVASPGWDTLDQIEAIVEYPHTPDVLILSYYINDIEGVAYESGAQRPQIRLDPPTWLKPLIDHSHALNFVYWRLIRLGPATWSQIYWEDWLVKIHTNPQILWRHQQALLQIVEGAAAEDIPLIVVIFPNLAAVDASEPMVQPIIDLFARHDIPVLDTREILRQYDPAETMVNSVDSHPNELIHAEVARRLKDMVEAQLEVR